MATETSLRGRSSVVSLAAVCAATLLLSGCNGGGVTSSMTGGASSSGSSSGSSTSSSSSGSSTSSSSGGSTSSGSSSGSTSSSSSGGGTVTATPYVLFSSNYQAYASQTAGAYVYNTQGGNVYAGAGGSFAYGGYSSPQTDMDRTQLYIFQVQAGAAPNTAGDYAYIAIKPPGSSTSGVFNPVDISQSAYLLVQMGNSYTASQNNNQPGGAVTVFTVDLNNDTSAAGNGSQQTAECTYDQTLTAVGSNIAATALGVLNYKIPLSAFTCKTGSMATLQMTGVVNVVVKFTGDKNPSAASGEFDTIAIGYIGFTL